MQVGKMREQRRGYQVDALVCALRRKYHGYCELFCSLKIERAGDSPEFCPQCRKNLLCAPR